MNTSIRPFIMSISSASSPAQVAELSLIENAGTVQLSSVNGVFNYVRPGPRKLLERSPGEWTLRKMKSSDLLKKAFWEDLAIVNC
jgi:hypothetical protein